MNTCYPTPAHTLHHKATATDTDRCTDWPTKTFFRPNTRPFLGNPVYILVE